MNKHSEQRDELFKALLNVQATLAPITQDATNPFFKSKYSTLENVWETVRGPLHKNGLLILQPTYEDGEYTYLETILYHTTSGQWQSSVMRLRAVKDGPQEYGSALSYARRYSLMSLLNLTSSDDDGEAAQGRLPTLTFEDFLCWAKGKYELTKDDVTSMLKSSGVEKYNTAQFKSYMTLVDRVLSQN